MNPRRLSVFPLTMAAAMFLTSACLQAQVNVLTQHNDNARDGQNMAEKSLTLANVNLTNFGKLASITLDGQVYAQPLVLSNVTINGVAHNVVFVATEHDSVYALDATTGATYWHTSFINPSAGITSVPYADATSQGCTDISPEYGITSTPVIDTANDTLYVVANTLEKGKFFFRLHALNVATGAENKGSPVIIEDPTKLLNAQNQNQRTALLLTGQHVVFGFSAHCDQDLWYGLVFSYNATTLALENVFLPVTVANGGKGGVWMGGGGLSADTSGNIYAAIGNGTYNGTDSWGDSIVKLPPPPASGTWKPSDWYTPGSQSTLDAQDLEIGGGSVLLLPNLPAGTPHYQRLAQAGKDADPSTISILDRNQFTTGNVHYCCSPNGPDTDIVQEINSQISGGLRGSPSYWNGHIYFGGIDDYVKAFSFNLTTGAVSSTPVAESPTTYGSINRAASISISANDKSNGIVWALDSSTGILHALRATNLTELYNSNQIPARDAIKGTGIKFLSPTIANGLVYVGANSVLGIYGLNPAGVKWSGEDSVSEPEGGCGAPAGAAGSVVASAAQTGLNTLTWRIAAKSGQSVSGISWTISDTEGTLGSGTITGSSATVTVSRLPVNIPQVAGTVMTFEGASPTTKCNVAYSIKTVPAL